MRDIKFRGKRVDNGEWVYGYYVFYLGHHLILADRNMIIDEREKIDGYYITKTIAIGVPEAEVIPETVGQYTGLKDKNGTEIYEGDMVEYENGNAGYGRPRSQEISRDTIPSLFDYEAYDSDAPWWKSGEVIGNIHEHGELLK